MKFNFKKTIKKYYKFYPFIVFSVIILYVTRKFIFKEENILYGEFFGSNNYFFFLKYFLKAWGDYTTLGHSNIGLTTIYGLNTVFFILPPGYNLPFFLLLSLIQLIIQPFAMKAYILTALTLPFIGMYFLAWYWFSKVNNNSFIVNSLGFISALIYSISALIGDRISAGHLKYNLAYGVFPLLFLFNLKAIEENNNNKRRLFLTASGLITGILIWLMPHLISLYLIVMGLYFLIFIFGDKKKLLRFSIIIILSGLIGVMLNIHVWLPALFFQEELVNVTDPQYASSFVYYTSGQIKLIDIITLTSGFEQRFINKTVYNDLIRLKFVLPVLALLGLIFTKKIKESFFLFIVGLTGVIFSLGVNYPFEKIYMFLFKNVFLFRPFREPGKFAILYLFSISLLIPYVFFYLSRFLNKRIFFLLPLLFTFLILSINPNFSTGNFSNSIVPFKLPEKYQKLNQFLSKKQGNFRVAVYPNNQSIGDYDWMPKTTNGSPYTHIFLLFPLSKNLANSNSVTTDWSSRYLDYIESNLDKFWAIERLGEEMTRYIIVDHSLSNYPTYLNLLNNNTALIKTSDINGFTIFEIKNYNKKILKEKPVVYYFGDIKGIRSIPSDLSLINLESNPVNILLKDFSNIVVLYNSSLNNLFYTSLKKFNFSFFPQVRFTKNPAKEFFGPGEYLRSLTLKGITFYNPEIIQTVGKNKITKLTNLKKGKYKILLRSLSQENETNGIKITIAEASLIRKDFRQTNDTFEWVDFGEIEVKREDPIITLENLENKSLLVDYLLIISYDQYHRLEKDFYSKIKSKKIISIKESEVLDEEILTHNQKDAYIFSQSFSPYWKICDRPIFRVNFYGTGTVCDKKTNIHPQFKPEFLYKLSIFLSVIFHLLIVYGLIRLTKLVKTS